jgi:hypothetical protein
MVFAASELGWVDAMPTCGATARRSPMKRALVRTEGQVLVGTRTAFAAQQECNGGTPLRHRLASVLTLRWSQSTWYRFGNTGVEGGDKLFFILLSI